MSMLNRCVLIVRAKKPFIEWLRCLPDPADVEIAEVNRDTTAYLLPDYGYDDEQEGILENFYDLIFEEELMGWWQDEEAWPPKRDMETFKQWFDVELHSHVLDLVNEPLTSEE